MTLTLEQVKAKSAPKLIGLQPVVLAGVTALIERCYNRGVMIVITQGLRTYAEQDSLYAQGRTKPGQIVTNARGGYSNHNFGWAVDFALLLPDGRSVSWDMRRDDDGDNTADWMEVVQEAKALGFAWGGDWQSFKDYPHLEMVFGLSTAQLRAGAKPSTGAVNAAFAKISEITKGDDEMSAEDKKRLDAVEAALASLTNSKDVLKRAVSEQGNSISEVAEQVANLVDRGSLEHVPPWAQPAVDAALAAGLINTPAGGSQDFYRILTVLHRAGLLITDKEV